MKTYIIPFFSIFILIAMLWEIGYANYATWKSVGSNLDLPDRNKITPFHSV